MITIETTPAVVKKYRALLNSEWANEFPNEVIVLLWNLVSPSAKVMDVSIVDALNPSAKTPATVVVQAVQTRVSAATQFLGLNGAFRATIKADRSAKPSAASSRANRLAIYLTLPVLVPVDDPRGLFNDTLALGFQAAINFALPAVRTRHPTEHAFLLQAATLFAVRYAAHDQAQFAYMMAMIHGYLGDESGRLKSLYSAFRFTPPHDHSFLTKAQEYWSELIDLERFDDAESFLFSLHWWALPSQQPEIQSMMSEALPYILSQRRRAKSHA